MVIKIEKIISKDVLIFGTNSSACALAIIPMEFEGEEIKKNFI